MGRFCDELREERERQGLSLETVSWSTKIARRHLQAIERGEFAQLPGGVFRKGFVRSYLLALQLEPAGWMERFAGELRAAGLDDARPQDIEDFAHNVALARGLTEPDLRLRWSGLLAMLVLLLMFGWCVWHFAIAGHVQIAAHHVLP